MNFATSPAARALQNRASHRLFRVAFVLACAFAFAGFTFAPAPAQAEGDMQKIGAQVFELCVSCHGPAAEGRAHLAAPAIAGMPDWYLVRQLRNFQSGARGTHFDDIEGLRMRPMARSLNRPGHLEAVAAYVAALPVPSPEPTLSGGDPERGRGHYLLCASCHGLQGEGAPAQNGPPMVGQNDWYLKSQLQKYQDGVRGKHPRDTYGLMMQPMSLVLADEKAIDDVVAYIMTLPVMPAAGAGAGN